MEVGEIFISLGIKGQEKTLGALSQTEKGLKGLASMSFEAKAAIVGAMYALERLFAQSGAQGTNLTNFSALLGEGTQTIQRYQYAARQMGVTNQETAATFKTLQDNITKIVINHGVPEGFAIISNKLGGFGPQDLNNFQKNPELLMQKLQEYAQKEKNIGVRNFALRSMGVGDNMIAAMTRGAFNQKALGAAPVYGDKELKSLDRANIAWSNLRTNIEMAVGHFNAAHGGQLVNDVSKVVNIGLHLVEIMIKIADKYHVFDLIDRAITLISGHVEDLLGFLDSMLGKFGDLKGEGKAFSDGLLNGIHKVTEGFENFEAKTHVIEAIRDHVINLGKALASMMPDDLPHAFETIADAFNKITKNGEVFKKLDEILPLFAKDIVIVGNALAVIAEKLHIFEVIGDIVNSFLDTLLGTLQVVTGVLTKIDEFIHPEKKKEREEKEAKMTQEEKNNLAAQEFGFRPPKDILAKTALSTIGINPADQAKQLLIDKLNAKTPEERAATSERLRGLFKNAAAPSAAPLLQNAEQPPIPSAAAQAQVANNVIPIRGSAGDKTVTQNIEVNQTIHFDNAGNAAKDSAGEFKRQLNNAARQSSALQQGS